MLNEDMRLGQNHALLFADVFVHNARCRTHWGNNSRARWVYRELEEIDIVDEDELIQLAHQCTRPRTSTAYRDGSEVRRAISAAKESNSPADWKKVHRLRKNARKLWQQLRLQRVLGGDWDQYRLLQNDKKRRRGWWGGLLQERSSAQLTQEVQEHLKGKMTDRTQGVKWDDKLGHLIESVENKSPFVPFQLHEVCTELQLMKCKSAVGPDGIGVHLLRVVAGHPKLGGDQTWTDQSHC